MADILTKKQRSYCMSKVKCKGTSLEKTVATALKKRGHRFSTNVEDIPGKPDIVFRDAKVVIFIDGDFWHGYRFKIWEKKLSPKWRKKISDNIKRDQRNFRLLRRLGWTVIRIWGHSIKSDLLKVIARVENLLSSA